MALSVCPAAIVEAPFEVVWALLTDLERHNWMNGRVVRAIPKGRARPGQTLSIRTNGLTVTLDVLEVNEQARRVGLRLNLPLGMKVEPHISCRPLDERSCRVQYG